MSMFKRGDMWWADLRAFGGTRFSLGVADEKLAKDEYRRRFNETRDGERAATLKEVYARCCTETEWATAKDQRGITGRWSTVSEFFGPDLPVSAVDFDKLSRFVGWMRKTRGVKDATIYRHLMLIGPILDNARRWGYLKSVPEMPKVKGESATRMHIYSEADEARILHYFSTRQYLSTGKAMADLVVFLADSGFRISEALSSFELRDGRAYLWDQKGGRSTSTPLTKRALAAAERRLWAGMTVDQADDAWALVRSALDLPEDAVLHAWRHTCATRLLRRGVNVKAVQAFMRHASLNTTMKYAKLLAGDLDAAAAALEPA